MKKMENDSTIQNPKNTEDIQNVFIEFSAKLKELKEKLKEEPDLPENLKKVYEKFVRYGLIRDVLNKKKIVIIGSRQDKDLERFFRYIKKRFDKLDVEGVGWPGPESFFMLMKNLRPNENNVYTEEMVIAYYADKFHQYKTNQDIKRIDKHMVDRIRTLINSSKKIFTYIGYLDEEYKKIMIEEIFAYERGGFDIRFKKDRFLAILDVNTEPKSKKYYDAKVSYSDDLIKYIFDTVYKYNKIEGYAELFSILDKIPSSLIEYILQETNINDININYRNINKNGLLNFFIFFLDPNRPENASTSMMVTNIINQIKYSDFDKSEIDKKIKQKMYEIIIFLLLNGFMTELNETQMSIISSSIINREKENNDFKLQQLNEMIKLYKIDDISSILNNNTNTNQFKYIFYNYIYKYEKEKITTLLEDQAKNNTNTKKERTIIQRLESEETQMEDNSESQSGSGFDIFGNGYAVGNPKSGQGGGSKKDTDSDMEESRDSQLGYKKELFVSVNSNLDKNNKREKNEGVDYIYMKSIKPIPSDSYFRTGIVYLGNDGNFLIGQGNMENLNSLYQNNKDKIHNMESVKQFIKGKRYPILLPIGYEITGIQDGKGKNLSIGRNFEIQKSKDGFFRIKLKDQTSRIKVSFQLGEQSTNLEDGLLQGTILQDDFQIIALNSRESVSISGYFANIINKPIEDRVQSVYNYIQHIGLYSESDNINDLYSHDNDGNKITSYEKYISRMFEVGQQYSGGKIHMICNQSALMATAFLNYLGVKTRICTGVVMSLDKNLDGGLLTGPGHARVEYRDGIKRKKIDPTPKTKGQSTIEDIQKKKKLEEELKEISSKLEIHILSIDVIVTSSDLNDRNLFSQYSNTDQIIELYKKQKYLYGSSDSRIKIEKEIQEIENMKKNIERYIDFVNLNNVLYFIVSDGYHSDIIGKQIIDIKTIKTLNISKIFLSFKFNMSKNLLITQKEYENLKLLYNNYINKYNIKINNDYFNDTLKKYNIIMQQSE